MLKKQDIEGIRQHVLPAFALVAAVVAIYYRVLSHEFILNWDDNVYVAQNYAIRGFTLHNLKAAFTSFYAGNYAPLQMISYMVDYLCWGLWPGGFLLTNMVIHAANGLLFYALLIRVTGQKLWAFAGAWVFLCHPVQVETVAWISQRKNLLAMMFFLLAWHLYLIGRKRYRQQRMPIYVASAVAFLLALLAKSVAVVFPLVLVLFDLCYGDKEEWKKRLMGKLAYVLPAIAVALLALWSQSPEYEGGRVGYHGGSPLATLYTMLPVFIRYVGMFVWPANLSATYDIQVRTSIDGTVFLAALLLALALAIGIYLYRRQRQLFFWYALFWVGLIPVSQIVPIVTLINDRYLYFPLLGSAALTAGAAVPLERLSGGKKVGLLLLSIPLLLLALIAQQRTSVWKDSLSLWSDAAAKAPRSGAVLEVLANSYLLKGQLDTAETLYRQALIYKPKSDFAYAELGQIYLKRGNHLAAADCFQRALIIQPRNANALNYLGLLYTERGNLQAGRQYLLKLIRLHPGAENGFVNLGVNYYRAGEFVLAERVFREALKLKPDYLEALQYLANVYLLEKKLTAARETYGKALALGGNKAELEYSLACVEALSGRSSESLAYLVAAVGHGFTDGARISRNRELDGIRYLPGYTRLMTGLAGAGGVR